jgi:hypothetical protein
MDSRKDDRDAKKSLDEATDNPWDANRTGADQQAAELQTDDRGERQNQDRFAPDPASGKQQSETAADSARQVSKDKVKEP